MNTTDNTTNNADALVGAAAPTAASAPEPAPAAADQVPASGRKTRVKAAGIDTDSGAAKPTREKKSESKADAVLKRLRSARGVSVQQLAETTGWQAHSVRGFLSGTVRKKLGLSLVSEVGKDGVRRYRIDSSTADSNGNGDAGGDEASA